DELGARSSELASGFANVEAVLPSPDGQKFLVQRGWPDELGTYLSAHPRGGMEPVLLVAETRFQADAGAQWEPAGAGVSFIDSRGLGLVAFDLRADEPVRIDFEAMGFEVSSVEAHAWGAGVLAFVVPGAEAPVIALYDLEAG